jgi:hypothetical protein
MSVRSELLDQLARVFAQAAVDQFWAELNWAPEMEAPAAGHDRAGADSQHHQQQFEARADGLTPTIPAAIEP